MVSPADAGSRLERLVREFAQARIRTDAGAQSLETIAKRVQQVPTRDLIDWVEMAIVGVGRSFDDFRYGRSGPDAPLGDAAIGAASLVLAMEELQYRLDHPEG